MAELSFHRRYLDAAWQEAQAAPLSQRKALLVALLIDAQVDRLRTHNTRFDDVLAFRQHLARQFPVLGLVMAVAAQRDVRLVTEAVAVPLSDYGALAVEDFMVSLYNDHSVQRVRLALSDGTRRDAHDILAEAKAVLDAYPDGPD